MAHYKVRDAIAPLRERLTREKNGEYRAALMEALFPLGGLRPAEITDCLDKFARKIADKLEEWGEYTAWYELDKPGRDWRVRVGHAIALNAGIDDKPAGAVVDLAQREAATDPLASEYLHCVMTRWSTPSSRRAVIQRLKGGAFSRAWLEALIENRAGLRESLHVSDLHGAACGIQAGVSGDMDLIAGVLRADDVAAQTALFACARLARASIPLDLAIRFLDAKEPALALASDKYFGESDSPAARAEIRKRARNKARVVGTQLNFSAFPMDQGEIAHTEKELRKFFTHSKPPREIYALLSEGNFGSDGQRALFVYDDHKVLRCADGNGRIRERDVSPAEFATLRDWIDTNHVADLPPYDEGTADGIQLQYVHITPDIGERVFMNNPPGGPMGEAKVQFGTTEPRPDPIVYAELTRRMLKLNEVPMAVEYPTLKKLAGYGVIHAKEVGEITALRIHDGELLAGVSVSYDKPIEWHVVKNDRLLDQFQPGTSDAFERDIPGYYNWHKADVTISDGPFAGKQVWAGQRQKDNLEALWVSDTTGQPELFARGIFADAVVCPGGEWIVAAKTFRTNMWAVPNGVVRIHVPTKRIFPVDLPPADNFEPVAWIDARKRVLLYQQRDPQDWKAGPEEPEFYLLDPVTGGHEKVDGEMRPFFDAGKHELQPTGNPNEFWAVLHSSVVDPKLHTTTIGKFDSYNFHFTPLLDFPDIEFESSSIFVDKKSALIWINVNGDLLRLSLPIEAK